MKQDYAFDLLSNLLERAHASNERTFLTSREIEALSLILAPQSREAAVVSEPAPIATQSTPAPQQPISPSIDLATVKIRDADIEHDVLLCVDFGTSFSKAFASVDDGSRQPELIDLPIGDGSTGTRLTTPSELFIDNGRIYFGAHARRRLDDTQAPADRLIDSIKQYITLNKDVSALGESAMPPVQDPTQRFSQRDTLVLYLAHLMALTEAALLEKGLSSNTRRRFTHPAWRDGSKIKNESEMRRMMAEAIVLARSASVDFRASLAITDARHLLGQLKVLEESQLPQNLIDAPVREATAAGAGALLATGEGKRDTYLVVDIGAGTTDVAGFVCANNPNNDRMRVFEVESAADAKNRAGNTLDNALHKYVMQKSGLVPDSEEYRQAGIAVRRERRAYKQELFGPNKRVVVALPTDENVVVTLEEFEGYGPVIDFNTTITEMVAKAAAAVAGDLEKIKFVATGGGASLPLVRELAARGVNYEGKHVTLILVDAIAEGVRESNPALVDPYPQIAVALGGSLRNLPQQMNSIATGLASAAPRSIQPMYRS